MHLPIGTVLAYSGSSKDKEKLAKAGFLLCDGSKYPQNKYAELYKIISNFYGGDKNNFSVPDYRGVFLRGCDLGRGFDPDSSSRSSNASAADEKVGSYQSDEIASHNHISGYKHHRSFKGADASDHPIKNSSGSTFYTSSTGGSETRPKNIYVNYIIFAGFSIETKR